MHLPQDLSGNKGFGHQQPTLNTDVPREREPTSVMITPLLRYPKTTLHNQPSEFSLLLEVSTGLATKKRKEAK